MTGLPLVRMLPSAWHTNKQVSPHSKVKIGGDGKVKDMEYEKRSGNTIYDQRAWEAVKKTEPFPPIPEEIKEDALEIGIRFVSE